MKKRILALLLTAAMALSVAGCGSSDAPAKDANAQPATQATEEKTEEKKEEGTEAAAPASGEEKDTFTIAISYMPDTLAPHSGGSDDYTSMTRPLYDKLFIENTTGGLDYYLADSLEISEDGKTYKIHIRDDAKWSDGTPPQTSSSAQTTLFINTATTATSA